MTRNSNHSLSVYRLIHTSETGLVRKNIFVSSIGLSDLDKLDVAKLLKIPFAPGKGSIKIEETSINISDIDGLPKALAGKNLSFDSPVIRLVE